MSEERFEAEAGFPGEDDGAWPPGDTAVLALLRDHLLQPETGPVLSEESVRLLDTLVPPVDLPPISRVACDRLCDAAELDLAFEERMRARNRPATLGEYLVFLRERAGLSLGETAKRFQVPFQWLTELERDRLAPQAIPAASLYRVLRRLHGTLIQTEELLASTIQASPTLAVNRRASLYRMGKAADRAEAEAASRAARGEPDETIENPEYRVQCEEGARLRKELRRRWSSEK